VAPRRLPPLHFLLPLVLFAAVVAFMAAGLGRDPKAVPSPLVGRPAPDFSLPRLDDPGRPVRRADLLGRPWVLNVWASWCTACREEHATLMDFARSGRAPLYGLDHKDTRPEALAWLARNGDPYTATMVDADGRAGIDFGVYGVPETFVIDRHGTVRFKHAGPLTPEVVRTRIDPLLQELSSDATP
jgi:cytochrome c biogenesis protein CcmG/thiol:disulfide interchange protein DsbE